MANDTEYAALMTNQQFCALAKMLDKGRVFASLRPMTKTRSASADESQVSRWLKNAWNSERVLQLNSDYFSGDDLVCCVHWAFPQAYYAVFATTLAYFIATGKTQRSHTAVIKEFGNLVATTGQYPAPLCFYADGPSNGIQFYGVQKFTGANSIDYDPSDMASAENQVAQFLSGTRQRGLDGKKGDFKFKNWLGQPKRRLSPADWQSVSNGLGKTSLLSLLYRKRIKANYDDIDVLVSSHLNAARLLSDLRKIVRAVNAVHEWFIRSALGSPSFNATLAACGQCDFVAESIQALEAK